MGEGVHCRDSVDTAVSDVRVLLVDDERNLAEVTAQHLERRRGSFSLTITTDGEQALSTYEDEEIDCVVSDYEMPEIDGLTLLRELRQRNPAIPFILYTGRGSEEIASEAISAGVTDYLQKRTTSDQYDVLANRIENAVARHRSEQARVETERRYQTLVETSPHAIVVYRGREILYVNDTVADLLGLDDRTEIYGKDPLEFVHPDDQERVERLMRETFEERAAQGWSNWRVPLSDGTVRYVESLGTPITYDGQPAVQVVIQDVTERYSHERRLESLNDATRELLTADDHTAVAGITLDVLKSEFGKPHGAIWTYWPDRENLVTLAVTEETIEQLGDSTDSNGMVCASGDDVEMQVLQSGEPRIVTDYGDRDDSLTTAFETVFMYPLGDDGLLTVASVEPDAFDESERDLLEIVGQSVAAAFARLPS